MSHMFEQTETDSAHAARQALAKRILVVMPVLNEAAHVEACLVSLIAGDPALGYLSLVVVDGGSTDGTQEIVRACAKENPNLSLLENPGKLQASGVNIGARARGDQRDILIRCDAHADYPADYVLKVAAALDGTGADSLVVPMDAKGTSCFQKANAWVVDTPFGSGGSAHRGGKKSGFVDHGHHAGFRLERFLALHGYDESFRHNEDAEYDVRLRKAGGRIYLDASIRIGYYPRANIYSLWQQYFGYGVGRARNLLKNQEKPRLRQLAPVANIFALVGAGLLALWNAAWLFWPAFYLAALVGIGFWLVLTKRSLCGLWGSVALGVMHVAWGLGFLGGIFKVMRRGRR